MSKNDRLINLVLDAIHSQDSKALKLHSHELNLWIIEQGDISESLFKVLVSILGQSEFHGMSDSFYLIKVFEDNFEYLSVPQRTALLAGIENSYENFVDETSCLLMAELVAALFADERSLQTLRRLRRAKDEMPRALIASGLEHFVRLCTDNNLVVQAKKELHEMQVDPSGLVQSEAAQSLSRIDASK
jgi:hypothetical protein